MNRMRPSVDVTPSRQFNSPLRVTRFRPSYADLPASRVKQMTQHRNSDGRNCEPTDFRVFSADERRVDVLQQDEALDGRRVQQVIQPVVLPVVKMKQIVDSIKTFTLPPPKCLTVKPRSLRFSTHTAHSSLPARAVMNEDLPQPGGPCSR